MYKKRFAIVLIIAFNSFLHQHVAADGLGGSERITSPIPDQLQGKFPVHVPELNGVEQLLVLSDRWVIIVSNKMNELFTEIDHMSGGEFSNTVESSRQKRARGGGGWRALKKGFKIRDKYLAEAREIVGERQLGEREYFAIHSPGDSNYSKLIHPARVDRLFVSAGQHRSTGGVFDIDYHIYSYLELPTAMEQGQSYTIALGDGSSVSFLFDRKVTISRTIKVNQVGYLPDAGQKRAYLGAFLYRFGSLDLSSVDRFEVINVATGAISFSGNIELLEANPRFGPRRKSQDSLERPMMYGEDVYVADFTKLKEEGVYFISVPGVGRSWPFRHESSAYAPAFYTSMRGMYHQRAGIPITEHHSPWVRNKAIRAPYCESEHIAFPMHTPKPKDYSRFDVIAGSIDCSMTTQEVLGGWHDAADWDSNDAHYTVVFDLLNAFAFNPKRFTDGQLNIPESGNGVPDILDEVRYGLEIWRHSMDEKGGVSGMLETSTHPNISGEVNGVKYKYAFSQRTRWSSLIFAAAAAQYAQLVEPFNLKDSTLYREASEMAYEFGNNVANSLGKTVIHASAERGKGKPYKIAWEEVEQHVEPYLLHAKLRLYLLTDDNTYLDDVLQLTRTSHPPYMHRFTRRDYSPWIFFSLLEAADALPKSLVLHWRKWFIEDAETLLANLDQSPYAATWPRKQDYWLAWGASDMTNFNRSLFIAHRLTGEAKYRDAAILNTDFMFGANPMGMSWTTGVGFVYPIDIQHTVSETDGIVDPVPGITIYGITGAPIYRKFREKVWESPGSHAPIDFVGHNSHRQPPLWRRWMVHPHLNTGQNEFTIHETMSSTIFSTAMLLSDNWHPGRELLNAKPRSPDALHGRWYLP